MARDLVVQPSQHQQAWIDTVTQGTDAELDRLVASESVGVALFQIAAGINGLSLGLERGRLFSTVMEFEHEPVEPGEAGILRLVALRERVRRDLDWREQREVDLGLLRMIRRSGSVSVVLGAGASHAGGGPLWSELVGGLLKLSLERGREISRMKEHPTGNPDAHAWRREVIQVDSLPDPQRRRAQDLLAKIATASIDELMEAAQLCLDFQGQALFTDVSQLVYRDAAPAEVHRAIAELADLVDVPDRPGGPFPGWHLVVDYNFDSLQLDAFTAMSIPARAWLRARGEVVYVPNPQAIDSRWHIPVVHLHGYTPSRPMEITDVDFVFSTLQYEERYGTDDALVGRFLDECLAKPLMCALYIGCSFRDEAMNGLLERAHARWPGRQHFAFIAGPPDDADTLAMANGTHSARGVQPLWVEDYDEIPDLIRRLR